MIEPVLCLLRANVSIEASPSWRCVGTVRLTTRTLDQLLAYFQADEELTAVSGLL